MNQRSMKFDDTIAPHRFAEFALRRAAEYSEWRELASVASTALAKQLDAAIKDAITEKIGEGWLVEEMLGRCAMVKMCGDPWERFILDGEVLLEVGPLESEMVGTVWRCSRDIRKPVAGDRT